MNYKTYFQGKKITVMGLGLLGRGLGDAVFLAEQGAELIVTDLRDKQTLSPSLAKLRKCKNIKYVLGKHRLEDFSATGGQAPPDFILKAAGVPLDSQYIAEARKNNVPIEMDASLFAKLVPKGVTIVGVTGTRGKSTTTALLYDILKSAGRKVYKGGNLVPEATLPLLQKVKAGDIVVLELDSWQLQGFHDAKLSPQIAIFTTFLDDHLMYYKGDTDRYFEDKVAIFKYQKPEDTLIAGVQAAKLIGKSEISVNGDFVVATKEDVPKEWKIRIPGEHNRENIACAIAAARALKIPEQKIKKAIERFSGVPGRLEFLRSVRLPAAHGGAQAGGVKIYNDNNATTPDATIAALRALGDEARRHVVLICGGTDKGLDMSKLVEEIPKYCKGLVLLKETGTAKLLSLIHNSQFTIPALKEADSLSECIEKAMKLAEKGDIILFSPAFASFGRWFKNEYDRGNQFVELVKKL